MQVRELTASDVRFTLTAEADETPVRGNALASGDDAEDRAAEDAILARLDRGDVWAWAVVTVRATWRGYSAEAHLGCCSYDDEARFRADPYFADLCAEALSALNDEVATMAEDVSDLAEVLP